MQVLCRADGDLTPFDDANAAVAALISTDLDPTADRLSIVPPTSRTALVAQFRPAKKEKLCPHAPTGARVDPIRRCRAPTRSGNVPVSAPAPAPTSKFNLSPTPNAGSATERPAPSSPIPSRHQSPGHHSRGISDGVRCSRAVRADQITFYQFEDRDDAEGFTAALGDNGYQSDWIVLEYQDAKYDTDSAESSYATVVDGTWTSE